MFDCSFSTFFIDSFCQVSWGKYGEYILDVKEVDGKNKIALVVKRDDADVDLILHDFQAYPLVWKNEQTGEKIPCYRDHDIIYTLRNDAQKVRSHPSKCYAAGQENHFQKLNSYDF